MAAGVGAFRVTVRTEGLVELRFVMPLLHPPVASPWTVRSLRDRAVERVKRLTNEAFTLGDGGNVRDDDGCVLFPQDLVSDVVDDGDVVVLTIQAEETEEPEAEPPRRARSGRNHRS
jgi:hypothetical protein